MLNIPLPYNLAIRKTCLCCTTDLLRKQCKTLNLAARIVISGWQWFVKFATPFVCGCNCTHTTLFVSLVKSKLTPTDAILISAPEYGLAPQRERTTENANNSDPYLILFFVNQRNVCCFIVYNAK